MTEQEKYETITLFQRRMPPKEIATQVNLPYGTVLKLKRDYEETLRENTVSQLVNMDEVILNQATDLLGEEQNETLVEAVSGLQVLNRNLQNTAIAMTAQVKSHLLSVEHVTELETLTDVLCKLQNAFFNKNTTQVNVQNNFTSDADTSYSNFLGDKPK